MAIHNTADNSFKRIFDDHRLFADFIRDFIKIDILDDIKPEDIEDLSERFLPLFQESRDADTVKRINLRSETPLFVIAILEHESKVNHRSSFKMLQYICLVLDAWEKEADVKESGSSQRKDFKYPPVLPIIFYDGRESWTAKRNFLERTHFSKVFEKYIPKFEYELVNLNDYSEEEIMGFGDALSLVLLIDKIRGNKGETLLNELPEDYIEKLSLQIPESLVKLLSDVIQVLLNKSGYDCREIEKYVGYVEKPDGKEYIGMFEAVIESIIEGREEARQEGREEGLKEGIAISREQLEAVARNALAEGLPLETICTITGLDIETIKGLAKR